MDRKHKIRTPSSGGGALPPNEILVSETLRVDLVVQRVSIDDQIVTMTPKVYELLVLLLSEPQRVHTRDAIFDRLWPRAVLLDANLTTTVSQLRKSLSQPLRVFLRTIPRVGYSWDAPVMRLPRDEVSSPIPDHGIDADQIAPATSSAIGNIGEPEVSASKQVYESQRARKQPLVFLCSAVLFIVCMVWIWQSSNKTPQRIAILLETHEPDVQENVNQWMTQTAADTIAQQLRQSPRIRLLSTDEVAGLIASKKPIGDKDGADARLSLRLKSVEGDSNRFLLIARLETAGAKIKQWQRASDTSGFIVEAQQIAASVADAMLEDRVQLRSSLVSPAAMTSYENGVHAQSREQYDEATAHLERAVAQSPGFTLARMQLAKLYDFYGQNDLAALQWRTLADDTRGLGEESRAVARAKALESSGNIEDAADLFAELSLDFPDEPSHRLKHIEMLIEIGGDSLNRAERAVAELTKENPSSGELWAILLLEARLRQAQGRSTEAFNAYHRLENLTRTMDIPILRADVYQQLGVLHEQRGELVLAKQSMQSAVILFRAAKAEKKAQVAELQMLLLPQKESLESMRVRVTALVEFAQRAKEKGYGNYAGQSLSFAAIDYLNLYEIEKGQKYALEAERLLSHQKQSTRAKPQIALAISEIQRGLPKSAMRRIEAIRGIPKNDTNLVALRVSALVEQAYWRDARTELETAQASWDSSGIGAALRDDVSCLAMRVMLGLGEFKSAALAAPGCARSAETLSPAFAAESRIEQVLLASRQKNTVQLASGLDRWKKDIEALPDSPSRTNLIVQLVAFLIENGEIDEAGAIHAGLNQRKIAHDPASIASRYWLNEACISAFLHKDKVRFYEAMRMAGLSIDQEHGLLFDEYSLLKLAAEGPEESGDDLKNYIVQVKNRGAHDAARRAQALYDHWRINSDQWSNPAWWRNDDSN